LALLELGRPNVEVEHRRKREAERRGESLVVPSELRAANDEPPED